MKYIMTAFIVTTMSFGAFALGQKSGSAVDVDCCKSGKCDSVQPCFGVSRNTEKREQVNPKSPSAKQKGKAEARNQ